MSKHDDWSYDELMGLAQENGDICNQCGTDMPNKGNGWERTCDVCLEEEIEEEE